MERKVPVIGISTEIDVPERIAVKRNYVNAVIKAGGVPFLLPFTDNKSILESAFSLIDGLLLTGGGDISPAMYGEESRPECGAYCNERDEFDYTLLQFACERQIPVLGICRGMQLINTYFGGTLYQDLPSQHSSDILHKSQDISVVLQHNIRCLEDSELYHIVRKKNLMIYSIHHQAIKKIADGFRATAFADDGIIEAIESVPERNIRGVQFHPELQTIEDNEEMSNIFRRFIYLSKFV